MDLYDRPTFNGSDLLGGVEVAPAPRHTIHFVNTFFNRFWKNAGGSATGTASAQAPSVDGSHPGAAGRFNLTAGVANSFFAEWDLPVLQLGSDLNLVVKSRKAANRAVGRWWFDEELILTDTTQHDASSTAVYELYAAIPEVTEYRTHKLAVEVGDITNGGTYDLYMAIIR